MEEKSDYLNSKVHRFDQGGAGLWAESVLQHRNAINYQLEQLRAKGFGRDLKELARAIEKWQLAVDDTLKARSGEPDRDRLFHLRLVDVEKLLLHLDGCFLRVLEDTRDRRLEELYSQYSHILHRVRKLEPTDMHANSTHMKRHLLDEVKDQQQKRLRAERENELLISETQEALYQKDKAMRELRARLQELEEALGKKDKLIRELRLGYDNTEQSTLHKDRVLRELRQQNDGLKEKLSHMNREVMEKDEHMDEYYKTVETLKRGLEETRVQLANQTRMQECVHCDGDSVMQQCKTINSGKVLRSSNGNSGIYIGALAGSGLAKQKMPPLRAKTPSKLSGLEEDSFQSEYRSGELLRMLLTQAASIQGLLREQGEGEQ